MVTASLPLPEYSSAYRPSGQNLTFGNSAAPVPSAPASSNAQQQGPTTSITKPAAEELSFIDHFFSFKKSAALKEERFLLLGLFNDVLKTTSKVLTGAFLTDVLKSLLKDANQTFEEVIYKTLMDSGPSRIVNDVANAFAVRLFNGNHSFLGLFKLPFIAPELSSQICPQFLIPLMRGATRKHNVNAKSANKNQSPIMEMIKAEIKKRNRGFYRFAKFTSEFFDNNIKPILDKSFKVGLGVEASTPLLDKEGNPVLKPDGKPKFSNPQVNKAWLGGVMAGSFIGSFFLPKFTQASGFEKVKSPLRAVSSVIITSLFRLRSTITHNGLGMHIEGGANFDQCFTTSVREKMLVPIVQYSADSLASLLSHKTKFINGAVISNILRVLMEIPAVFISAPSIQVAAKDRVNDAWKFLSYKVWRPTADLIEKITRPLFEPLYRLEGTLWGMFDPTIPYMYGHDIDNNVDALEPEIDKKYSSNPLNVFGLLLKKTAQIVYKDTPELLRACATHSADVEEQAVDMVNKANKKVDLRIAAEKALEKLDLQNSIKPETQNSELNERIVELATRGTKQDLVNFLSKPVVKVDTKQESPTVKTVAKSEETEASDLKALAA